MRTRLIVRMSNFEVPLTILFALIVLISANAFGQRGEGTKATPPPPPPPVPLLPAPPAAQAQAQTIVYDQKPLPPKSPLIHPQQAQALIEKFKAAYPKLGSPRMLIYVNRNLVDEETGLRMIARTEKTDLTRNKSTSSYKADANHKGTNGTISITGGGNVTVNGDLGSRHPGEGSTASKTEKSSHENRYRNTERKEPTLADRQTVRDVERLFGRPLRTAGAKLADQRLATQLVADHPFKSLDTEGEQARKDREALSKIADVVVEVLISSKNVQAADISGDKTYVIPDIQATAMRLKDSEILGQASSSDIIGKDHAPGYYVRNYSVNEIAEATALALMEDMLTGPDAAK